MLIAGGGDIVSAKTIVPLVVGVGAGAVTTRFLAPGAASNLRGAFLLASSVSSWVMVSAAIAAGAVAGRELSMAIRAGAAETKRNSGSKR